MMEEILKELIKTTLEKGPQNKQFYSNLSITKPIHDQAEIQIRLGEAIAFLKSSFQPGKGFQSKLYTNRNCAIESARVCSAFRLPDNTAEVLTSVLALDLLFNSIDNEQFMTPTFQEICNFSEEIQDALHSLIVPSCGISTFNLFKELQQISPIPQPPSPLQNLDHNEQFVDSGNDSPTSMLSSLTNQEEVQSLFNNFPDDINTSMITLIVLIHQGILQSKPVESVLKWIISNVFSLENGEASSSKNESSGQSSSSSESDIAFPAFITRQGNSDPVGVANVLNLMYLLDISHEEILNAAEEFLVTTLKDTLTLVNADETVVATTTSSSKGDNSLGNTQKLISSGDNGQEAQRGSKNEEDETSQQQLHQQFVLQHHSPDSLLYFLSRALAITPDINNSNCGRRPYINQMKSLLLDLLDVRLGTTMNTCDLAMRILAGVYLGVVNVANNTSNFGSRNNTISNRHQRQQQNVDYCSSSLTCDPAKISRINNLLQKEFELLVSLQADVDGSWQADSIVQVGFTAATENDSSNDSDYTNVHGSSNGIEMVGYLGGKELATLFAVKAISVFLSWKKGGFVCDDEVGLFDFDNAKHDETDLTIHQMY